MTIVLDKKLLSKESEVVELEEGQEIAHQLQDIVNGSINAAGLAAPQIGIFKRVCVIQTNEGVKTFINPKITETKEPFIFRREGCLSFPGVWLDTIRYNKIKVVDDLNGEIELHNFAAVACQHEVDHLMGVLFFDREVPDKYSICFCGSSKKFKFCCMKKLDA